MRLLPFLCLSSVLAGDVSAQPPRVKTFRIVDSLRIDTRKEDLFRELRMALRADGTIAISSVGSRLVYFDSLGKRRWVRLLNKDVRRIDAIGWNGDSLFVVDNNTEQVLFVGSNGGVGGFIELPDLVRPQWKDRRSMSAYGKLDVAVVTTDGFLIGTPRYPRNLGVYGTVDPARRPVVRTDHDGMVQQILAVVRVGGKGDHMTVLPDGRVVVLSTGADSLAFTAISPLGGILFTRSLPKAKFIGGAVGGPDGTIWVTTGAAGYDLTHTAFDAKGTTLGQVVLSNRHRVSAGDARHLWVTETVGASNRPVMRYTLKP